MAYVQIHQNMMNNSASQRERGFEKPRGLTLKLLSLADRKALNAIT